MAEETLSGADSKYLKEALGDVLVDALAEICERVPRDPIEYLSRWLLHKAKLEKDEEDERIRKEQLQQQLEQEAEVRENEAKCWAEAKQLLEEESRKRREKLGKCYIKIIPTL